MIPGFEILAALTGLLVALGVLEWVGHRRNLARIPVRIHVNGTRGKSSVTRLIAAGLRAGGRTVCAKTTGTLARMILPDGRELPVFRPARPNVIEQVRIVRTAAANRADALVVECMALQPFLQWMSEWRFVRATHAVITNARADHLDVMGPDEAHVAQALCGMVPPGQLVYTAERRWRGVIAEAAADRGAGVRWVDEADVQRVTDEDLAGFPYTEHRENLALALRVCEDLGVARDVALRGMWAATPDPGAMTEHVVDFFGRTIAFVNGFAANDPESTEQIWRMALDRHSAATTRIAVFNCRADRTDRSRQLGEACARWTLPDHLVLVGTGTYVFGRAAQEAGLPPERLVYAEGQRVDQVFETLAGLAGQHTLVMGMGNIGGIGLELCGYFQRRVAPRAAA